MLLKRPNAINPFFIPGSADPVGHKGQRKLQILPVSMPTEDGKYPKRVNLKNLCNLAILFGVTIIELLK